VQRTEHVMDEKEITLLLQREGYDHTFVWEDRPNAYYPEHIHNTETAHIILSGQMTLTVYGRETTYLAGERCDVAAGAVHSARMGPEGCRYLIGER
jgi:quercetin dioxygenase-like cupin family protein